MNTGFAGLAVGVVAMVLSIADSFMTGRLVEKAAAPKPAPAPAAAGEAEQDPELQALRMRLRELATELLGLNSGPITSVEQLRKVVDSHLAYRRRRDAVHQFTTRRREVRSLAKDWVRINATAFRLSEEDQKRVSDIMNRFIEDWMALASATSGEPELEDKIEALIAAADRDILAILPEAERKRYRPIPRGWSSGMVGDAAPR
ncbi:MAG: hypothetical protein IT452_11335 [Planctomycetia bacterium]|nr:hypothetical protein [Planctomycetia bacterium]